MVAEYIIDIGSLIVDKQTGENLDNGIINHKEFLINAVQNGDIYICDIIENIQENEDE
jgi:hypothetical protein